MEYAKKLPMIFSNRRMILLKTKKEMMKIMSEYKTVEQVPGYNHLLEKEKHDVIEYIRQNLKNKSLCIQAATHASPTNVVYNSNRVLLAAHGWHVETLLGKGKDGVSFLGYQFSDNMKKIQTVKLLSNYGLGYSNHTEIFSAMLKQIKKQNNGLFQVEIESYYSYYNSAEVLSKVDNDNFKLVLPTLCKINSWCIQHTGFVFWDFGFSSGRNYMLDSKGKIKWIDYGGAGMLRCPNFETVYNKYKDLPRLHLTEPTKGKENLLIANSQFIMCQFLLHCEYWQNPNNSTADVWSSMLQSKKQILPEISSVIYNILYTDLSKSIYKQFKNRDWTDHTTWSQLKKFLDANT